MFFKNLIKKSTKKYQIQILPSNIILEIDQKKTILQSLLENNISFPHNCRVGSCTTCKSKLIQGRVQELTDKAFVLEAKEIQENYILVCQSIPKSDLVIENAKLNQNQTIRAKFIGKNYLTPDILEITVYTSEKVFYKAGQYVNFYFDWLDRPRSYSMANKPEIDGNHLLKFFIRLVPNGKFTEWLFSNSINDIEFSISLPEGNFYLRNSRKPMMLIAGGSGLAPIFSLLEDVVYYQDKEEYKTQIQRKVILIFGVRTQRDLYKLEELNEFKNAWQNEFWIVPILSNAEDDIKWKGEKGYIHNYVSKIKDREFQVYMCGPPVMIDACLEVLKDTVPKNEIFFDKFTGQ